MSDVGVSVVIPCLNPEDFLFEAIASARAQKDADVEIIVVDDGSNRPESLAILERARPLVDVYITQPNKGTPGARNTGCAAARHEYFVPLDCDDWLEPDFISECINALRGHPEAAFAYSDVIFFGDENRLCRTVEYDLDLLLDRNFIFATTLIPLREWKTIGGYSESLRVGYEDWEFYIRLGGAGRFGIHVPKPLYHYRKHGATLYTASLARHDENILQIREINASLYSDQARRHIKTQWSPAVQILGGAGRPAQTLIDCTDKATPPAPAILEPGEGPLDSNSAELAALSVWAGNGAVTLPDGSRAYPRPIPENERPRDASIRRHLENAGLLSIDVWLRHPARSLLRLVPVSLKQKINEAFDRRIFDLTFYRQFRSLPGGARKFLEPLRYCAVSASRARVAIILADPQGPPAEMAAMQTRSFDRSQYELLLIVTSPSPPGWRERWRKYVDLIYDLGTLIPSTLMDAAVETILRNWRIETVIRGNDQGAQSA